MLILKSYVNLNLLIEFEKISGTSFERKMFNHDVSIIPKMCA